MRSVPLTNERPYGGQRPILRKRTVYAERLLTAARPGDGGELDESLGKESHCQDSTVPDPPLGQQDSVRADSDLRSAMRLLAHEERLAHEEQGQRP